MSPPVVRLRLPASAQKEKRAASAVHGNDPFSLGQCHRPVASRAAGRFGSQHVHVSRGVQGICLENETPITQNVPLEGRCVAPCESTEAIPGLPLDPLAS